MTEGLRMGDEEEMIMSWLFTKEQIDNSPSRQDGISASIEAQARSRYCYFIRWMCNVFKFDLIPTATALTFCHRFYSLQSLAKNDWKTIATACVFLASKSEDVHRLLDDIVKIAFAEDVQNLSDSSQQKEFLQKKRELIDMAERVVLTTIRFDTNVSHPYRPLHNALQMLGIRTRELREEVWKLVACWLDTTVCLQYKPEAIAAATLHILAKLHDLKLPDVRGLSIWSEKFAPEQLDAVICEMVQILCMRKWPNCEKMMDRPVLLQPNPEHEPEPEPEPDPKSEQATSIQKLPGPEGLNKDKLVKTPDLVLDLAVTASKKWEAVQNRNTLVLDSSSLSKDALEQKEPERKMEGAKFLDKTYMSHIREIIRKRKRTAEMHPTVGKSQLDASRESVDAWIERELESGIIVGLKPVTDKRPNKRYRC